MSKISRAFLILLFICLLSVPSLAAAPSLISESAVLIDGDTGQVLYNKSMDKKQYPASITKIATVITALENASLSDKITMSDEAVFSVSRASSHIALDVGEEITLEQACYAALLMSANDACNGMAELVSGKISEFVKLMNDTAAAAGARGTHFSNANGLKDSDHYTTAYDMAMICRYAIKNKDFRKIFGTYKYDMPPNNKQPLTRHFVNQHSMISDPAFKYDGIIGGKAGWTTAAQYTLVTAAERDGHTLIAVVMKSPRNNDKYNDTKALLDYGFSEFEPVTYTTSDLGGSNRTLESPITVFVPKGVGKNGITSETVMENGKDLLKLTLNAPHDLMQQEIGKFPYSVSIDVSSPASSPSTGAGGMQVVFIVLSVIIGLAVLFIATIIIRKKIYRMRRRYRTRRRNERRK